MSEGYVKRFNPNFKTEAYYLRAFVNHFSFLTGLMGALTGKSGHIGVNVILDAYIHEGCRVANPLDLSPLPLAPYHNVLEGRLCQCSDLLSWIGGTFDSNTLKEKGDKNALNGPTEFTIEKWVGTGEFIDEWTLKSKTHWGGVKWLDAAHTGDGGSRMCAGIATFVCNSKVVEEIENGEVIITPPKKQYSNYELRKILQQRLPDPKHSSGYMG
jgi:hypothetical protein